MIGQLLTERYLVLKILGTGGFSETYVARDKYLPHHPLCVVKYLKLSAESTISSETARRLFELEARILDRLGRHHSQIPTLLAHCHEQDQSYHVQEYIDGENLGDWISQKRRLTSDEAIALLLSALPVLEHVHSHQVIHRDIKPGNLIRRNGDGKIILIDFGAACLASDNTHAALDGQEALAIGTPGYMPEEQQNGEAQFNSDLYALGMTVIHLLTGVHPRYFHNDPISGEVDWQCHLREPIDASLAMILSRMVQHNARDRYQRAVDVLRSLRAIVTPNQGVRSLLWNWRNTVQVLWKPAMVVVLLAGVVGGWQLVEQQMQWAWLPQADQPTPSANLRLTLVRDLPIQSTIHQMLVAPNNQILVTTANDRTLRLWSLPNGTPLKTLSGHTTPITAVAMSRDSRFLVSGGGDRTLRLWDVGTGRMVWKAETPHQGSITAIAISADAQTLASGSQDGTIHLWDLKTGKLIQTLALPDAAITALVYGGSPDHLVSASSMGAATNLAVHQLQVWDLRTGQLKRTFAGHTAPILGLQVADPQTLISFGQDRAIVWNVNREELVQVCGEDTTQLVAGSLNPKSTAQSMLAVYKNGNIRVWSRSAGQLVASGAGNLEPYRDVAISPDLNFLVGWSQKQRLQVWRLSANRL